MFIAGLAKKGKILAKKILSPWDVCDRSRWRKALLMFPIRCSISSNFVQNEFGRNETKTNFGTLNVIDFRFQGAKNNLAEQIKQEKRKKSFFFERFWGGSSGWAFDQRIQRAWVRSCGVLGISIIFLTWSLTKTRRYEICQEECPIRRSQHSTEVEFALLAWLPWVWFLVLQRKQSFRDSVSGQRLDNFD